MVLSYRTCFNALLIMMFLEACNAGANREPRRLSQEEIIHEIIADSGPCTLITLDSIGQPRARIMDPFAPEDGFVVWFGTNSRSRKVKEINLNQRVTVNYFDATTSAYVSLYGKAEVIHDDSLKVQFWKPTWTSFYPNYPEDYCLIKFTPDYLEFISEKHDVTGDPDTWKPAVLKLQYD